MSVVPAAVPSKATPPSETLAGEMLWPGSMMTVTVWSVSAVVTSCPAAALELLTVAVSPGPPARAAWIVRSVELVPLGIPRLNPKVIVRGERIDRREQAEESYPGCDDVDRIDGRSESGRARGNRCRAGRVFEGLDIEVCGGRPIWNEDVDRWRSRRLLRPGDQRERRVGTLDMNGNAAVRARAELCPE